MNKKSLIVQHNNLIDARYKLGIEEQKIIKILISQIEKEDEDFKNYDFRIKDLAGLLGMDHKDPYGVLRGITKKLLSRILEFYNPETKTLLQASWLSSAEYKKGHGTVSLCFDPKLKPLLLQIKAFFTKYELEQVLRFTGQYTIRFFELRKASLGQHKKEVVFDLKELYLMLGLGKKEYRIFRDFKNRVLEPARKELLEKTGMSFTWEPIRQGRGGKITGVQFLFERERETQGEKENKKVILARQNEEEEKEPHRNNTSNKLLVNYGVSNAVAEELASSYEERYIMEKVALAEAHPEYVKNRAGFIIQAIKENWVDADVIKIRQEEMRRNAENERQEREKRLRGIWERYRVQKANLGLREYEKRPSEEIEQLKKEFLAGVHTFVRGKYEKKENFGYEDGMFRNFFLNKLNLPTFDMYLVAEGITLSDEEKESIEQMAR